MRFIKLTKAVEKAPVWVRVDKICKIFEYEDETCKGTMIVFGMHNYVIVAESLDEVVSKCEAQGR